MPENTATSAGTPLRSGIDTLAPDFTARSTSGEIRLSDYRGQWVLFLSHPADFTPVCTSEFIALQKSIEDFQALNCQLLGLSVDSLYSHIAWVTDIERNFKTQITFPIIEDISMSISRVYGMIHEASASTAAVRSVYYIDPQGYIRALFHYPMNVGRSVAEMLRVLHALQQSDELQVSTPEGWQPGQDAVLLPPTSQQEANARINKKDSAWYLTRKELPQ